MTNNSTPFQVVNVNENGKWLNSILKVINPSIIHIFYAKIMHRKFFLSFLIFFQRFFILTHPRVCFSFLNRKRNEEVKAVPLRYRCEWIDLYLHSFAMGMLSITQQDHIFLRKLFKNYSLMCPYSNAIIWSILPFSWSIHWFS